MDDYKYCYACGVTQPSSAFYRQEWAWDGLSKDCRKCTKAHKRQTYHGPNREGQITRSKAWIAANYDHFRAYQDHYYGTHNQQTGNPEAPYKPRRAPYDTAK